MEDKAKLYFDIENKVQPPLERLRWKVPLKIHGKNDRLKYKGKMTVEEVKAKAAAEEA